MCSCALFPKRLGYSDAWDTRQLHTQNEWQKNFNNLVCRIGNFIQRSGKRKRAGMCHIRCYIMRWIWFLSSFFFQSGVNIGYMGYQTSLRCLVNFLGFHSCCDLPINGLPFKAAPPGPSGYEKCARLLEAGISEYLYIKITNHPVTHKVWKDFLA